MLICALHGTVSGVFICGWSELFSRWQLGISHYTLRAASRRSLITLDGCVALMVMVLSWSWLC